jgi:hypothetical protein
MAGHGYGHVRGCLDGGVTSTMSADVTAMAKGFHLFAAHGGEKISPVSTRAPGAANAGGRRRLFGVVASSVLFVMPAFHGAFAHDAQRPDLDEWYTSLQTAAGGSCCDKADCKVEPYGADEKSDAWIDPKTGMWKVRIDPKYFGPRANNKVYDAPPQKYAKQMQPNGSYKVAPNLTEGIVVCWTPALELLCVTPPLEF